MESDTDSWMDGFTEEIEATSGGDEETEEWQKIVVRTGLEMAVEVFRC
jgi:hypothetical protein